MAGRKKVAHIGWHVADENYLFPSVVAKADGNGRGSSEFVHLCSCVTARGTHSCSVPRVSDPSTNSEDPNPMGIRLADGNLCDFCCDRNYLISKLFSIVSL
jgi:hypothetical protein